MTTYEFYFTFIILPLAFPAISGFVILIMFWRRLEISHPLGSFVIQLIIAWIFFILVSYSEWFTENFDKSPILLAILSLIPAFILIIGVFHFFRKLFATYKSLWVFLFVEIVYWLVFLYMSVVLHNFYGLVVLPIQWVLCLFPSLYSIIALIVVYIYALKLQRKSGEIEGDIKSIETESTAS